MAKLSISLPNSALITLESEEPELVHEVLRAVLQAVQHATSIQMPVADAPFIDPWTESGPSGTAQVPVELHRPAPHQRSGNGVESYGTPRDGLSRTGPPAIVQDIAASPGAHVGFGDDKLELGSYPARAREDFVAFCQSINPTGDMRRVVVAADAANRFFGLDGVHADEVGELFDLIGWRRANSFTQTIRNAARAKFGWMERIPGRSGRYAATDVGRSTTLTG